MHTGGMEYVILLLVVAALAGGGVCAARHAQLQKRQAEDAELQTQLSSSHRAADDDVTQFGEELHRLDAEVSSHPLDESLQRDYARASTAYDNAKTSLGTVGRPEEIREVTEILEDGRHAIAGVKARLADQPLPQKRPPCLFNPTHGPSSVNVSWAPAGGVAREVPACPADAERVLAGADPYIRTVQQGDQRVPYWEGGQAYAPWAQGYYRSWRGSDLLSGVLIGSFLFGGTGGVFNIVRGTGAAFEGMGFDGLDTGSWRLEGTDFAEAHGSSDPLGERSE